MSDNSATRQSLVPEVSDYEMLRCVGTGAFGDVWLARAKPTKRFRAIKVVCRSRFPRERIYEIEFAGLKKFEELSREHAGFIDILHVSRNDETGCFSYVMELADDLEAGQSFDPEKYVPKTVASELDRRQHADANGVGRFTPAECVQAALSITAALSALHQNGLVHRDLKPSNIVFVRGLAKLADVGLVTELKLEADDGTLIGSPPYMDEQVHGTAQGDLYGFGKVLYVMATGRSPLEWPAMPADLDRIEDPETFHELIQISHKACDPARALRYKNAEQIHSELLLLRVGHSLRRLQRLERIVGNFKRFGVLALIIAGLVGLVLFQSVESGKQAAELRQRKAGFCVAYGVRALDEDDLLGALPWFAEALCQDRDTPRTGLAHRLRLGTLLQQCPTIVQMWFTDCPFNFAQFAGQENQVLLPTADGHWAVHDLASGRMLYSPFGKPGSSDTVSISPATGLAATSSMREPSKAVTVWSYVTGQEVASLSYDTPLTAPAISLDGRWVAAAASNNAVVWNLATRERFRVLPGHTGPIRSIAFSPDGHRLVTGSEDSTARVWDLASGVAVTKFTGHRGWLCFAAFSPDGRLVATSSFDRSVRVWEADSGREVLPPLWHGDGVRSVEFSADGTQLVTAGLDFSVRVWDARRGRLLQQLRHNSKPVYAAFSPSGRHIVTACYDGTERVWALRGFTPKPLPVVFSGNGACFASTTNQTIQIFDAAGGQPLGSVPAPNRQLLRVLLNRDGSRLLTLAEAAPGSPSDTLQAVLWDCKTGLGIGHPVPLDRVSTNLVFSPDGHQVFAFAQGRVTVWDFDRNREVLGLPVEGLWLPLRARRVAFEPAGERLAVALSTNVQVWDLSRGQPLLPTPWPHRTWVDSVDWSPDARYVVTACSEPGFDPEYAQVWDSVTGQPAGAPLNHRDGVRFATFSPDGKKVITCGEDFAAMLWEWHTGRQITPPLRHKDIVVHAAFSPDGRWVATACLDGTARVWDVETGEPVTQDLEHPEQVVCVQWVDRGRALLTKTITDQTRLWKLTPDQRPLQKLVQIAELLSAEQIHSTESAMPETKEALQKLWQDLRSDDPANFSLHPE
ncbi:MAG: protein kinase family protein [Limisphaerales bacterium]